MKKLDIVVLFSAIALVGLSCGKVTFNMSGASVGAARTCQVVYFENRAEKFYAPLSSLMTDALRDKIQASTSMRIVNSNPDVMFEGEITGYNTQSEQITTAGVAQRDRLTITVKVRFTNALDSEKNYDKSFSRFSTYPGGGDLSQYESGCVDEILKELMEDIFNEAFASW